jgi:hypothetical protein
MKDFQGFREYGGEEAELKDAEEMDDFELCRKYLYHSSDNMIPEKDCYCSIFEKGDGYGELTANQLSEMELWYDWSHVRDSSEEAIHKMAVMIREYLGTGL